MFLTRLVPLKEESLNEAYTREEINASQIYLCCKFTLGYGHHERNEFASTKMLFLLGMHPRLTIHP